MNKETKTLRRIQHAGLALGILGGLSMLAGIHSSLDSLPDVQIDPNRSEIYDPYPYKLRITNHNKELNKANLKLILAGVTIGAAGAVSTAVAEGKLIKQQGKLLQMGIIRYINTIKELDDIN